MSNTNRELALIAQQKNAEKVQEQLRAKAEAEAKKLLHTQRNVVTYSPAGMLSQSMQQQLQERAKALAEGRKPKTPEQQAQSFDVRNAVANLRAMKGIEAPEFANETEYLPSADEILGTAPEATDAVTPLGGFVDEEPGAGTPLVAPEPEHFDARAYAQTLITTGQARSQGHALDLANREAAKRAKKHK